MRCRPQHMLTTRDAASGPTPPHRWWSRRILRRDAAAPTLAMVGWLRPECDPRAMFWKPRQLCAAPAPRQKTAMRSIAGLHLSTLSWGAFPSFAHSSDSHQRLYQGLLCRPPLEFCARHTRVGFFHGQPVGHMAPDVIICRTVTGSSYGVARAETGDAVARRGAAQCTHPHAADLRSCRVSLARCVLSMCVLLSVVEMFTSKVRLASLVPLWYLGL